MKDHLRGGDQVKERQERDQIEECLGPESAMIHVILEQFSHVAQIQSVSCDSLREQD